MRQRIILVPAMIFLFLAVQGGSPCQAIEGKKKDVRDAIVKIETVFSNPSYYSPWTVGAPETLTGSGCVIRGKRILTNAHVVANGKFIQIQRYGDAKKFKARVLFISHESDLALLTVDNDVMFNGIEPLEIGELPDPMQEVVVYGYPTGGESMSITKGILSRIEYQEYVHGGFMFLAGQIDAAINPGNSGGPIIVDGKIAGVAMQVNSAKDTENIGYMIPSPVIRHFLRDIEDGKYRGSPELGILTEKMENPGLKRKYGVAEDQTGVLVYDVHWKSAAGQTIKKGDVLLAIDGHQIADDGTVELRPRLRVSYFYYVDTHQLGEEVKFDILRKGQKMNVSCRLNETARDLFIVPTKQYDVSPTYFIFGGIVFSPLSRNLICSWTNCKAPDELTHLERKWTTEKRKEAVVALQVLPADVNRGYHELEPWIVNKVNGKEFADFREFFNMLAMTRERFIVFEDEEHFQVAIDREDAADSLDEILKTYHVGSYRSEDLR